jgi:glutathione S-transferase
MGCSSSKASAAPPVSKSPDEEETVTNVAVAPVTKVAASSDPLRTKTQNYDVILWAMKPSANSSVVRAFLELSDLTFKEEEAYGMTRTPDYISKFPTNLSPAIECEGKNISECVAILKFLCRTYPLKYGKFYPEEDLEKVTTIDWLCDYITQSVLSQLPKAVYPTLCFPTSAGDVPSMDTTKPYTTKSQEAASEYLLQILNSKFVDTFLKDTTFLLSNEPTIADYRFAPMINFIKVACLLPDRLEKYYSDMAKIPGFEKACAPVAEFTAPHWKSG